MYEFEDYAEIISKYYSVSVHVTVKSRSSYDEDKVFLATPKTLSDKTNEYSVHGSISEIIKRILSDKYDPNNITKTGVNQYSVSFFKKSMTDYYGSWLYFERDITYDFTFSEISHDSYVKNKGVDITTTSTGCLSVFLFLIAGLVLFIYIGSGLL